MTFKGIPAPGWPGVGMALGLGLLAGMVAGRYLPGGSASSRPAAVLARGEKGTALDPVKPAGKPSPSAVPAGPSGTLLIPHGTGTGQTLRNILAIPDSLDRLATLKAWCQELAPEEVIPMLAEFKKMMEAQERIGETEAVGLFFQSMDVISQALLEQGAGRAMAAFLGPDSAGADAELREGAASMVFNKWANQDLAGARGFLENRLGEGAKITNVEQEMSKNLMRAWVRTDPDAAMAWLLRQPKDIAETAAGAAFQTLSHHNPDKALQLVAAQADLPGRDAIAATIAGWWARTTPDKALGWAQGLPEKLAGPSVKETMATWAAKDFPAAREAMAGLSAPLRDVALPALVTRWENKQWSGAAAFLEKEPGGRGREEAMGQLIQKWAGDDQQAASAWLARQTPGPERDTGATALAAEVRESDPEAAAIWGMTLGDAGKRQQSLKSTLESWYKKSLPEARQWLETTPGLTESDRAALMGTPPSR